MEILISKDMSMKEIIDKFPKTSDRTIIRKVDDLLKSGRIEHKRIHGEGKRKRYCVVEENTKQDLTMRAFDQELIDIKIIEPIHATITQRHLSEVITQQIKSYKEELNKLKNESDNEYYSYHVAIISGCLEWINRLTFAINAGLLGDSPNKLNLAHRNKERYEEFLQKLIYNIKKKDKDMGYRVLGGIYNELVDLWFMERALT